LDKTALQRLRKYHHELNISVSELIRRSIDAYLEDCDAKTPKKVKRAGA
jgi:hypothetical protein